jgi:hypothetical protein
MSRRTGGRSAIGVGIATLVTIMVAVLLTTFSVLTLVTAGADLRLSEKTVQSAENYYLADGDAEQWLADLDAFLAGNSRPTTADLSSAGYKTGTAENGGITVVEEFPIDDIRELSVEVALGRDGTIDILRWQSTLIR